jgi:hypothetical protein
MCLVLFGWLVSQKFFVELTDVDIRKRLYEEEMNRLENRLSLPIIPNTEQEHILYKNYGDIDSTTETEVWYKSNLPNKEYIPL